jgi:hypothetical protein
MRGKRIREELRAGQPIFTVGPRFRAPWLVEMLARSGADQVFLDAEHGPQSRRGALWFRRRPMGAGRGDGGPGRGGPRNDSRFSTMVCCSRSTSAMTRTRPGPFMASSPARSTESRRFGSPGGYSLPTRRRSCALRKPYLISPSLGASDLR